MKIAILITGHIRKSVSEDYDVLLKDGMELPANSHEVFDLPNGDKLPDNIDFAGIVISGSSKILSDGISWLEDTAEWLRKQVAKNTPILGICFGHQLLAYTFGGKVTDNPKGIEVGTKTIDFNENAKCDQLLKDFCPSILAQVSHVQSVTELPENAIVLAFSELESHHAFRIGENIWGLQFHPEFDAAIIHKIIVSKSVRYPGKLNVQKLISEIEETPKSYSILKKFGEIVS